MSEVQYKNNFSNIHVHISLHVPTPYQLGTNVLTCTCNAVGNQTIMVGM